MAMPPATGAMPASAGMVTGCCATLPRNAVASALKTDARTIIVQTGDDDAPRSGDALTQHPRQRDEVDPRVELREDG